MMQTVSDVKFVCEFPDFACGGGWRNRYNRSIDAAHRTRAFSPAARRPFGTRNACHAAPNPGVGARTASSLASIAAGFALFAADLAAAPGLGHAHLLSQEKVG